MNTDDAKAKEEEDGATHPISCSKADTKREAERLAWFLYELYKNQQNIKSNTQKE